MISNLDNNIKRICKDKGIQLKDLASKMNISPESLSRALHGNPRLSTITSIANALDVNISELFTPKEILPTSEHTDNLFKDYEFHLKNTETHIANTIKVSDTSICHAIIYHNQTTYITNNVKSLLNFVFQIYEQDITQDLIG